MNSKSVHTLKILLAEDDKDDRFLFGKALKELSFSVKLTTVTNGESLMEYLHKHKWNLPDILFLDINMPRKNGIDCLKEIKNDIRLEKMSVVIFSTGYDEKAANDLYNMGAHLYIRKPKFAELEKFLGETITLLAAKKFARPKKEQFLVRI